MFDDPSTSEKEAKQAAEFVREPVAIVSREGKLLAYYIPEDKQ
jgi:PHD/YefM family antitoxin component YafN of YafNO toxin-antitoxin module